MLISASTLRRLLCGVFLLLAADQMKAQTSVALEPTKNSESHAVAAKVDQRVELMSIVARLAGYEEYVNNQFKSYAADVDSYFANSRDNIRQFSTRSRFAKSVASRLTR